MKCFWLLYQPLFTTPFTASVGWTCILIKLPVETTRNAEPMQGKQHFAYWKIR